MRPFLFYSDGLRVLTFWWVVAWLAVIFLVPAPSIGRWVVHIVAVGLLMPVGLYVLPYLCKHDDRMY